MRNANATLLSGLSAIALLMASCATAMPARLPHSNPRQLPRRPLPLQRRRRRHPRLLRVTAPR